MKLTGTLRNSLTIFFVASAVLPLLLFGIMATEYLVMQRVKDVEHDLSGHAYSIFNHGDLFLGEVESDLDLVKLTQYDYFINRPDSINVFLDSAAS